jgi:Lon protease-like protein
MAEDLFEVPLFPLNLVLFPGMALPLHIFEPCYREMTAHCLADQAPFGVVLAQAEGEHTRQVSAKVGTFARIADSHQLPDGRYNLLACGTHRFEIVEWRRKRPYLTGLVRPYRDHAEEDIATTLVTTTRESLRRYLEIVFTLVGTDSQRIEIPEEASELSFLIGMCLTDDADKQRLLEMTSVNGRLQAGGRMVHEEAELMCRQLDVPDSPHLPDGRAILN